MIGKGKVVLQHYFFLLSHKKGFWFRSHLGHIPFYKDTAHTVALVEGRRVGIGEERLWQLPQEGLDKGSDIIGGGVPES